MTARADGPIGQPRGVGFVILISIVTFGIYHFYWVYKNFHEMQRHTGQGIGGVLALVIAILLHIVIWFVMPSEVGKMYRRRAPRADDRVDGALAVPADRRLVRLDDQDPGCAEPLLGEQSGRGLGRMGGDGIEPPTPWV